MRGSEGLTGPLFKAPASVENGSTYIKKTFSSYNRSTYKPSLTVNYDAGGSQTVANGTSVSYTHLTLPTRRAV